MPPVMWLRRQKPKSALLGTCLSISGLSSAAWLLPSFFALLMGAFGPPDGLGWLLAVPSGLVLLALAIGPAILASRHVCAAEASGEQGRAYAYALAPMLLNVVVIVLLLFVGQ